MFGTIGFGAAAFVHTVVALFVLRLGVVTREATHLSAALLITAAWASAALASSLEGAPARWPWLISGDVLHAAAWAVFAIAVLRKVGDGAGGRSFRRVLASATVALAFSAVLTAFVGQTQAGGAAERTALLAMLALPMLTMTCLLETHRRASPGHLEPPLSMTLGIGVIALADVVAFLPAVWRPAFGDALWELRGYLNAVAAPLIAWGSARWFQWKSELYVSRQIVFHSTTLVSIGFYAIAIGTTTWFVITAGAAWGLPLQIALVGIVAFILHQLLFSDVTRRRTKAFVTKHFYRDRYDYRREWLRLIETLIGRTSDAPIPVRAVKALTDIVGSPQGELWLRADTTGDYQGHGAWGMPVPTDVIRRSDPLAAYLESSHWVVDTLEYEKTPSLYSNAFDSDPRVLDRPSIFVPIVHKDALIGIARLARPPGLADLSFEDHDLLKTAGQQVAVFLVQERAQQELLETRQFEAYSKLTAFLTHDLKNMIAQQDLVVANARRFKHRPEFIDDAITTIAASVERMRKILERLQSSTRTPHSSRFDLNRLLVEVCSDCADRSPVPVITEVADDLAAEMDRDSLKMAVMHLIRNAQDATPADGRVELRLLDGGGKATIDVSDTGCGMEPEFVRNRLFRPFDSTKGAQGMGIGAYQIRETLLGAGGSIEVHSEPGVGTTMRLHLPLATRRQSA